MRKASRMGWLRVLLTGLDGSMVGCLKDREVDSMVLDWDSDSPDLICDGALMQLHWSTS